MRGNDRVIATPRLPPARTDGPASTFKFEEAPITEVVHVMLGEILKTDYVLHQPVTGNVTLATRSDVSADQAVFLLETALQANGIVMARDARGVYHVGRPDALKGIVSAPRLVGNGTLPPGSGAIIVPLQYIGAAEMATILRPMVPGEAILRVDNLRNLLVMAGTRAQAEGWLELINTFDVDLLKGMSVGIFPLKYATVREVEAALSLMTGGGAAAAASRSAGAAGGAQQPGGGATAGAGASAAAQAEGNPFFGAVRIMPIERISSILVVAPRASSLDEARKWIERFDRPSDNSTEAQLFVYPVQNGSAKHLASVLSGIFGGSGGSASGGTGVAPGLGSSTGTTQGFGNNQNLSSGLNSNSSSGGLSGGLTNRGGTSGLGGVQGNQSTAGVTSSTLGQSGVRIIADEVNNAILIWGPRSEYRKIEASLRRLDIRSAQVLIEAMIVEVTLKDDLQYGLEWSFKDVRNNGNVGNGALTSALGTLSGGFSYSLANAANTVKGTLKALADKSLVKVISSPSVMVMDNQVASILVGDQVPIKTGETIVGTTANTVTNYQYKDTGVNLAVTPSVNAGNIVTMLVAQTITDVAKTSTDNQPTFTQRQLGTKVAIRSGETLVLGGLIKDNTTTAKTGIPLLQDIPVAGKLFGSNTVSTNRTELLVILTPRVIRSDEDARELNEEVRGRMATFTGVDRLDSRIPKPGATVDNGAWAAQPFSKGVTTP
jgi:general secretion pathway protein D